MNKNQIVIDEKRHMMTHAYTMPSSGCMAWENDLVGLTGGAHEKGGCKMGHVLH
jgi:hypothetical protein